MQLAGRDGAGDCFARRILKGGKGTGTVAGDESPAAALGRKRISDAAAGNLRPAADALGAQRHAGAAPIFDFNCGHASSDSLRESNG